MIIARFLVVTGQNNDKTKVTNSISFIEEVSKHRESCSENPVDASDPMSLTIVFKCPKCDWEADILLRDIAEERAIISKLKTVEGRELLLLG